MAKTNEKKSDPMAKAPSYVRQEEQFVPSPESAMPFPMIKLLQQLSPELDSDDTKFIPNAKAGDIIITDGSSVKMVDGNKGIQFSPILVRKIWTEWIPRQKGGGFIASYNTREEMEAGFTIGNEVVVSIEYLVVSEDMAVNGTMTPMLLQFNTPTKMAAARELQKYIVQYKTMYGVTYTLTCKKQSNKAGQKFFNYQISPAGWTDKKIYACIEAVKSEKEILFLPDLKEDETSF